MLRIYIFFARTMLRFVSLKTLAKMANEVRNAAPFVYAELWRRSRPERHDAILHAAYEQGVRAARSLPEEKLPAALATFIDEFEFATRLYDVVPSLRTPMLDRLYDGLRAGLQMRLGRTE